MLPDPDAFDETPEERLSRIEQVLERCLAGLAVESVLTPGRRRSDIALLKLRGPKQLVLAQPLKLLDQLPHEDIELLSSTGSERAFVLTLIITERLEQQTRTVPERRAKLRHQLELEHGKRRSKDLPRD